MARAAQAWPQPHLAPTPPPTASTHERARAHRILKDDYAGRAADPVHPGLLTLLMNLEGYLEQAHFDARPAQAALRLVGAWWGKGEGCRGKPCFRVLLLLLLLLLLCARAFWRSGNVLAHSAPIVPQARRPHGQPHQHHSAAARPRRCPSACCIMRVVPDPAPPTPCDAPHPPPTPQAYSRLVAERLFSRLLSKSLSQTVAPQDWKQHPYIQEAIQEVHALPGMVGAAEEHPTIQATWVLLPRSGAATGRARASKTCLQHDSPSRLLSGHRHALSPSPHLLVCVHPPLHALHACPCTPPPWLKDLLAGHAGKGSSRQRGTATWRKTARASAWRRCMMPSGRTSW